jgi:exopolysaccharide biosynthesis predicted pyruvyltransferase EpsI
VAHPAARHDWKEVQHRQRGLTRDVDLFLHSLRENDHQIGEPQIFVLRGNLNIIGTLAHSKDVVARRVHEKIDTNLIAKPLLISTKSLQNATQLLQDNLKSLARDRLSTGLKKINSLARDHLSIDSKKRSREESSLSRQDVNLLITIATNP